jgi:ribonuclease Z
MNSSISFSMTRFFLSLAGVAMAVSSVTLNAGPPGNPSPLPAPVFEGGTRAITLTPIVGTPHRKYTKMYVPGDEKLEDGELRVTVLGSGNPWVTRAQASASILVEVGNPERDLLVFDLGSGALANYAALKLPVNKLNKVFLTHLHPDHMSDLLMLIGSYAKVGRADGPVYLWGPSGTEPRLGTKYFANAVEQILTWDTVSSSGPINPKSLKLVTSEFAFKKTHVVYRSNGVTVTAFPVVHATSGSVGYRLDFAGLSFVFSGDARPSWPLVRASEGGVDLLIHECSLPATELAAETGLSIERATMALNAAHTSPKGAGKIFSLVHPRMAGLWHTPLFSSRVIPMIFSEVRAEYDGPVTQTQDLTVFNITKGAVVARQAKVSDHLPPIPGVQSVEYTPVEHAPPAWWANELIPIE